MDPVATRQGIRISLLNRGQTSSMVDCFLAISMMFGLLVFMNLVILGLRLRMHLTGQQRFWLLRKSLRPTGVLLLPNPVLAWTLFSTCSWTVAVVLNAQRYLARRPDYPIFHNHEALPTVFWIFLLMAVWCSQSSVIARTRETMAAYLGDDSPLDALRPQLLNTWLFFWPLVLVPTVIGFTVVYVVRDNAIRQVALQLDDVLSRLIAGERTAQLANRAASLGQTLNVSIPPLRNAALRMGWILTAWGLIIIVSYVPLAIFTLVGLERLVRDDRKKEMEAEAAVTSGHSSTSKTTRTTRRAFLLRVRNQFFAHFVVMVSYAAIGQGLSIPIILPDAALSPLESWRYQVALLWTHVGFGLSITVFLLQSTIRKFLHTRADERAARQAATPHPVSPGNEGTIHFPAGVILAEKARFDFPDNRMEAQKASPVRRAAMARFELVPELTRHGSSSTADEEDKKSALV